MALLLGACAPDEVAPGYGDKALSASGGEPGIGGAPSDPVDPGSGGAADPPAPIPDPATSATTGSEEPAPLPKTGGTPESPDCDLNGRFIVTQRSVEEALGVQQAVRGWQYYEFSQDGQEVVATRGLDCGFDVVPISAVAGAADVHRSWPQILVKNSVTGRRGLIKPAGATCALSFPTFVSVYGATVSYYRDPSRALPGPDEQAAGSTPGWEDWDGDGKPGMTYRISGLATGLIFEAARYRDTWAGTTSATTATSFTMPYTPRHDADLLGYDGSPLLTTEGTLSANAALHFVEFARLADGQATGDDAATCEAVRALAGTLTPHANAKQAQ